MNILSKEEKSMLSAIISERLKKIWNDAEHCWDTDIAKYNIIVEEVLEWRRFTLKYNIELPLEIIAGF